MLNLAFGAMRLHIPKLFVEFGDPDMCWSRNAGTAVIEGFPG